MTHEKALTQRSCQTEIRLSDTSRFHSLSSTSQIDLGHSLLDVPSRDARHRARPRPYASAFVDANASLRCVKTVSHTPVKPSEERQLRRHADAHRCCVKLMIRSELVVLVCVSTCGGS